MRTHTLDTNVFSLNFAKDGNISESEIKNSSRLTDSQNMDSESARELMLKLLKSGKLDTKKVRLPSFSSFVGKVLSQAIWNFMT